MSKLAPGRPRAITKRVAELAAALAVASVCLAPAPSSASQEDSQPRQVVIAVFTDPVASNLIPQDSGQEPADVLLRKFTKLATTGMFAGLMSTTQGDYVRDQSLLDLSQGSRLPRAVYREDLEPLVLSQSGSSWRVAGWDGVVDRARTASTTLRPGLLASSVEGGAAYLSASEKASGVGALAAEEDGSIAHVSLGNASSFLRRVTAVLSDPNAAPLVVAEMPAGTEGTEALTQILRSVHHPTDLVLALHLPPTPPEVSVAPLPGDRFFNQTAFAIGSQEMYAGSPFPTQSVGSATTRRPGLIASVDVAPTVLAHLGETPPRSMRGHLITAEEVDPLRLEELRRRWSDVRGGRQASSVRNIILLGLALWAGLGIATGVRQAFPPSLRAVGLAFMWFPAVALAVAPWHLRASSAEALVIGGTTLVLGAVTDRLIAWPRAALIPAGASLVILAVDLARRGPLLTASVLAPSVASGNRFYGVSNELEPLLPALVLFALTGLAPLLNNRFRIAAVYGVLGAATAGLVGSGRLGADVGGVVSVAGAFTIAAFVASGIRPSWKLAAAVLGVAALAMASLIALDLLFGGDSHLSNNLTRLSSGGEFAELILRRYQLAAHVALQPTNLLSLTIALAAVALVVRNRDVFLPHVPSRVWLSALIGTLAGGRAGALSNDSGPILFVNSVIAAAAGVVYLAGVPRSGLPAGGVEPAGKENA